MSREAVILIETDEVGNVRISVAGCTGPECQTLTRSLEQALGDVVSDEKTPEYFQEAVQQEKVKARQ